MQARADCNFFLEADTNNAGAMDLPILVATGVMNQAMGRITLDKVSNTFTHKDNKKIEIFSNGW